MTEKYRGSWETLKLNNEFILAIENVEKFPSIVATYIFHKADLNEMKEIRSWIWSSELVPLYTEEAIQHQREAYDYPESISNFLIKVFKFSSILYSNNK